MRFTCPAEPARDVRLLEQRDLQLQQLLLTEKSVR